MSSFMEAVSGNAVPLSDLGSQGSRDDFVMVSRINPEMNSELIDLLWAEAVEKLENHHPASHSSAASMRLRASVKRRRLRDKTIVFQKLGMPKGIELKNTKKGQTIDEKLNEWFESNLERLQAVQYLDLRDLNHLRLES